MPGKDDRLSPLVGSHFATTLLWAYGDSVALAKLDEDNRPRLLLEVEQIAPKEEAKKSRDSATAASPCRNALSIYCLVYFKIGCYKGTGASRVEGIRNFSGAWHDERLKPPPAPGGAGIQ